MLATTPSAPQPRFHQKTHYGQVELSFVMDFVPASTRCPVAECEFGDRETKRFEQVVEHVSSADDAAHERELRRRDWTYEYDQVA